MKKVLKFSFNKALFLIWLVIFIGIAVKSPSFLTAPYIINVMLRNIVEIGMVALPMTLIIITGGIDLSVGNTMILSAMLGGIAYTKWGTASGLRAAEWGDYRKGEDFRHGDHAGNHVPVSGARERNFKGGQCLLL